jgi:hypothetical protein
VGVVAGNLYAIGGYNGGPHSTVEMYDPVNNSWSTKASMPTARGYLVAGVVDEKIYAVSGSGESTLYMYDPYKDSNPIDSSFNLLWPIIITIAITIAVLVLLIIRSKRKKIEHPQMSVPQITHYYSPRVSEQAPIATQYYKYPPPAPAVNIEALLESTVNLIIPQFIDIGESAEIIVEIENKSQETLHDVTVDFSDFKTYFEVEGTADFPVIKPGAKITKRVKLISKPGIEGTFPVTTTITSRRIKVEKEYTIKVGGTEIY